METSKLPIGFDSFEKLRTEGFYYVDKSLLIRDLLNGWGEVNVIDHTPPKGEISRMIYDGNGDEIIRIDNTDHDRPLLHPFGSGDAHYVRYAPDENGILRSGKQKALTAKMRRLCADILP